jgi:hypothetical protein
LRYSFCIINEIRRCKKYWQENWKDTKNVSNASP